MADTIHENTEESELSSGSTSSGNCSGPAPMVVADPLAAFEKQGQIKVIAPAKANLFLGVGEKRTDGFHDVTTVMHALTLHDVLHIDHEMQSSGGLVINVTMHAREGLDLPDIVPEENLVYKAIKALGERLGRTEDETVHVRVEKHIPHQAGLGGGSSDAAAALVGAAQLWGLDPLAPEVIETAQTLGSDIAFFLRGGCASFEGKGEVFVSPLEPMQKFVALIKPPEGISTGTAYRAFDAAPQKALQTEIKNALASSSAEGVPLYNNLTDAALSVNAELKTIHAWIAQQPETREYLLCGSGSATVVFCDSMNDASSLVGRARLHGWWARTTSFSPVSARVVTQS